MSTYVDMAPLHLGFLSISPDLHVAAHLSAFCVLLACLWHLQHEYAFKDGWRVRFTCHSLICSTPTPTLKTSPNLSC